MKLPVHILQLEDNSLDAELIRSRLRADGLDCECVQVDSHAAFLDALKQDRFDIILADHGIASFDGVSALAAARQKCPEVPFILVSGTLDPSAVKAFEESATDYVPKDRLTQLAPSIRRALREAEHRRKAHETIREQAALLDIMQEAVLVCDLNNCITFWNRSAQRIYGWTTEEAAGRKVPLLLSNGISPEFEKARAILFQTGEWRGEMSHVTKDRRRIMVESRWAVVPDEENRPKSILMVNRNVTEKKQFQALLHAQRTESLGAMASGITHNLNNALAPIMLGLQILRKKLPDDHSQRLLASMEACVRRAASVTDDILHSEM